MAEFKEKIWMQTSGGSRYLELPVDLQFDKIEFSMALGVQQISRSLSKQCRYNGHCKEFYSVAQHSVMCSIIGTNSFSERIGKIALFHDAAEAVVSDVTSPLKAWMRQRRFEKDGSTKTELDELEDAVQEQILKGLKISEVTEEEEEIIKKIDMTVCAWEAEALMPNPPKPWNMIEETKELRPVKPLSEFWLPKKAEKEFMNMYMILNPLKW